MNNMKSFFLLATLLLVVVLSLTFHSNSRKYYLKDLLLVNVEALANKEIPQGGCLGFGSVDCPIGNIKVKYIIY